MIPCTIISAMFNCMRNEFIMDCRFKDKAIYGYGTSIPPNNNEDEENEMSPRKVIFCVHGKLSGCCTVMKGSLSGDEHVTADYQQNTTSTFFLGSV